MDPHEEGPPETPVEKSSKIMFLVMLAIIIGLIVAFLLLRPNPGASSRLYDAPGPIPAGPLPV